MFVVGGNVLFNTLKSLCDLIILNLVSLLQSDLPGHSASSSPPGLHVALRSQTS